jgi:hypothetical protein
VETFGFQGQREKDRLGDVLRRMRVTQPQHGTGVHEVGVLRDQFPERLGGTVARIPLQQRRIVHRLAHFTREQPPLASRDRKSENRLPRAAVYLIPAGHRYGGRICNVPRLVAFP